MIRRRAAPAGTSRDAKLLSAAAAKLSVLSTLRERDERERLVNPIQIDL